MGRHLERPPIRSAVASVRIDCSGVLADCDAHARGQKKAVSASRKLADNVVFRSRFVPNRVFENSGADLIGIHHR
ncbi:unnamed protein product, partial [Iphiclides podalirius]